MGTWPVKTGTSTRRRHPSDGDRENLRRLLEVSKAICSILDLDDLLNVVMENVLEVTRAERGLLMLYDDAGKLTVRVANNFCDAFEEEKISRSIALQVAETGVPVCATNVEEHEDVRYRKSVLELGLLSVMCVPLAIKNRILGVIYVDSRKVSTLFGDNSLAVFSALAEHAAVAIENARLYEMAITDQKTGLYNHSHFRRRLEEEVARHCRYGRHFALMMIDLDHFKSINDRFGHQAGDKVLVEVARIIMNSIRSTDLAARFGGEEFAVILAETDGRGEKPAATGERLRASIENNLFRWEERLIDVTVSIGVAAFPSGSVETPEAIIEEADRQLYRAKHLGRNRVCKAGCDADCLVREEVE